MIEKVKAVIEGMIEERIRLESEPETKREVRLMMLGSRLDLKYLLSIIEDIEHEEEM